MEDPKVALPTCNDLKMEVHDSHVTTLDMCKMFFTISLDQDSQKDTNFWFNNQLYCHSRLAMGLKILPYIAQQASFSESNFEEFLAFKGWKKGGKEMPFKSIQDFLKVYLDDVVIWNSKKLEDSFMVHLNILQCVFFCIKKMGFKLSKSKFTFMKKSFKFLAFEYSTEENYTQVPEKRLRGFEKMRYPIHDLKLSYCRTLELFHTSHHIYHYSRKFHHHCKPWLQLTHSTGVNWKKSYINLSSS